MSKRKTSYKFDELSAGQKHENSTRAKVGEDMKTSTFGETKRGADFSSVTTVNGGQTRKVAVMATMGQLAVRWVLSVMATMLTWILWETKI